MSLHASTQTRKIDHLSLALLGHVPSPEVTANWFCFIVLHSLAVDSCGCCDRCLKALESVYIHAQQLNLAGRSRTLHRCAWF